MGEQSTHRLSSKRLARLLAACAGRATAGSQPRAVATTEEILDELLHRDIVLDPADPNSIPAAVGRPCNELLGTADRNIHDLLLARDTDAAVLRLLKDYGKALVRLAEDREADSSAAKAVYYAAIASALVFHQQKITRHSFKRLQESFAALQEKPWTPPELKDVFRRAQTFCEGRTS